MRSTYHIGLTLIFWMIILMSLRRLVPVDLTQQLLLLRHRHQYQRRLLRGPLPRHQKNCLLSPALERLQVASSARASAWHWYSGSIRGTNLNAPLKRRHGGMDKRYYFLIDFTILMILLLSHCPMIGSRR